MPLALKNRSFLPAIFTLVLALLVFGGSASAQEVHACVVMPVAPVATYQSPVPNLPAGVQKAVALGGPTHSNTNFWPNGGTLRVRFLGGSSYVRQQVIKYAQEWTSYANLNFQFVTSGTSDIRISFTRNGSSWSMLGRQARYAPANQPTMNFGWFTDQTPDYEFRRTVLHEFGHALGLLHEHQNPSGGIPWNEAAVYDFYRRTQGWDRPTTYQNVIAKQSIDETQYSAYDAQSIMHYPIAPQLTQGGYEVGLNTALSPTDASFIARMYPGRSYSPPAESTTPTDRPDPVSRPTETDRSNPPESPPAAGTYEVAITNSLGQGQQAEIIELYLKNRKYVFRLQQGKRTRQTFRLRLPAGTYDYRIRTASVYSGLRRVWDGRRYVERRQEKTVRGSGQGRLMVRSDGKLAFFGKYNRQTGRMEVSLGRLQVR